MLAVPMCHNGATVEPRPLGELSGGGRCCRGLYLVWGPGSRWVLSWGLSSSIGCVVVLFTVWVGWRVGLSLACWVVGLLGWVLVGLPGWVRSWLVCCEGLILVSFKLGGFRRGVWCKSGSRGCFWAVVVI